MLIVLVWPKRCQKTKSFYLLRVCDHVEMMSPI